MKFLKTLLPLLFFSFLINVQAQYQQPIYAIEQQDFYQNSQQDILSQTKYHKIKSYYPKKRFLRKPEIKTFEDLHPKFNLISQPNYSENIYVNTSMQKSTWENSYINKRSTLVKNAIENLTGYNNQNLTDYYYNDDHNYPKIAFVCSGGGYRAMIMTLGFMLGASQITRNGFSLIDATSYISTLSGSTWFLGLMLTLNHYFTFQPQTISGYLKVLKEYLKQTVNCDFWDVKTLDLKAIETHLWNKFLNNEGQLQTSDLWGAILADRLFKTLGLNGKEQEITFELTRQTLDNSMDSPFPIFTSDVCNIWPYYCMETNPYTTGFIDYKTNLGGYIPTNTFESPFNNGISKKIFPEESLGSFFGIFGSAYSISFADILDQIAESSESVWFKSFVNWVAEKLKIYKDRFLKANVDNFFYKMDDYPLSNLEKITVADSGMSMINLPFIPTYNLDRQPDIFIVCDAADDSTKSGYPELKTMQDYAKEFNLPFPSLKNPKIYSFSTPSQTYKVSVFEDENPNIPTIVYFPCYTPESTLKFDYSNEEFELVCGTIENMVINCQQAIIDSIKNKIDTKTNNLFEFQKEKSKFSRIFNTLLCIPDDYEYKKF